MGPNKLKEKIHIRWFEKWVLCLRKQIVKLLLVVSCIQERSALGKINWTIGQENTQGRDTLEAPSLTEPTHFLFYLSFKSNCLQKENTNLYAYNRKENNFVI